MALTRFLLTPFPGFRAELETLPPLFLAELLTERRKLSTLQLKTHGLKAVCLLFTPTARQCLLARFLDGSSTP